MPSTSLLPGPPVVWAIEYLATQPYRDASMDANAWDPLSDALPHKGTTEQQVPISIYGGTGQHRTVGWLDGLGGYQWWNEGNTVDGFSMFHPSFNPVIESTGSAGFIYPESTRFGWWRVSQAFTPTAGTNWDEGISGSCGVGVAFVATAAATGSTATPAVPTPNTCMCYAGICGVDDGGQQGLAVGTWNVNGGVASLGASLGVFERWHTIDLMLRQATSAGNATLRILLNGAEVADLTFGTDIRLPSAETPIQGPTCFFTTWCGQKLIADRPGTPRWLGPNIHFRGGAFNDLGVPLLS